MKNNLKNFLLKYQHKVSDFDCKKKVLLMHSDRAFYIKVKTFCAATIAA